jgi:hypothetical protein
MSNKLENQLNILKTRFETHRYRHPNLIWDNVEAFLRKYPNILDVVTQMEETGGEPDLYEFDQQLIYVDCSKETPALRRNLCYDESARLSRKKFPPENSAEGVANAIGIKIVDEALYMKLQSIEAFDLKTSSWLLAPKEFRSLGGALFGDRRYDRTFIYHNGADSYYGVRGFRGYIDIPL